MEPTSVGKSHRVCPDLPDSCLSSGLEEVTPRLVGTQLCWRSEHPVLRGGELAHLFPLLEYLQHLRINRHCSLGVDCLGVGHSLTNNAALHAKVSPDIRWSVYSSTTASLFSPLLTQFRNGFTVELGMFLITSGPLQFGSCSR